MIRQRLDAASTLDRPELIEALALRAQTDDEACGDLAWAILRFELARPPLRRFLIGDADLRSAEQATLVAVALRLGSWRHEARFSTWLHQVATNEARQLIRSESRHADRVEISIDTETATSDAELGDGFLGRISSMVADEATVQRAIGGLPDHYRQALELREYEGLTYDEIATRLDVPINTAKTRLSVPVLTLRLDLPQPTTANRASAVP